MTFVRKGRSWRALFALLVAWGLVLGAYLIFDAALWILAIVLVFTLPAAWDFATNPTAGLTLDADQLRWYTGKRSATLHLTEIDHMRFDTRWDFSVRVSAVLKTGKKVRLPYESLPPHKALDSAFEKYGIAVKRHHFTVF